MSATIRSPARNARALLVALAFACAPALAMDRSAPPLPDPVAALAPDVRPQGGGELRYFGLSVYDGYFWSAARSFSVGQPFALDLHYHRNLKGDGIAARSIDEVRKLAERIVRRLP